MLRLTMWAGGGAVVGAVMGYFGRCSGGTCPLTSTCWRGALYGAFFWALAFLGAKAK